jgi:hypothetical protein
MNERERDSAPALFEKSSQAGAGCGATAWVDGLLQGCGVTRRSPDSLDAMLDFRGCLSAGEDAGVIVGAYFGLSPVLSRDCYLTQYRVRKEVERRVGAVVSAPEWTDDTFRLEVRLARARTMRALEGQLKREFFERVAVVVPLEAVRVDFVLCAGEG